MHYVEKAAELFAEERERRRATDPNFATSAYARQWTEAPEHIHDEFLMNVAGLQCLCRHPVADHYQDFDIIDHCSLCECDLFTLDDDSEPGDQ